MDKLKQSKLNVFGLAVWSGTIQGHHAPHHHNEVELNCVTQGYMTYILAGQQETVSAGETAAFWAALPHQVIDYAPVTALHWVTIPLEYVMRWELPRGFAQALLAGQWFRRKTTLYDSTFYAQWQRDIAQENTGLALAEISAMLQRLAQDAGQPDFAPPRGNPHRAQKMAQFMSQSFQQPLTIAEIAAVVGLHPNYAITVFKDVFGISPIDYLTQQRIAHAQQLLILTESNITDVALASGFQTLSHFYNTFKRLRGTTPGQYRSSLRT